MVPPSVVWGEDAVARQQLFENDELMTWTWNMPTSLRKKTWSNILYWYFLEVSKTALNNLHWNLRKQNCFFLLKGLLLSVSVRLLRLHLLQLRASRPKLYRPETVRCVPVSEVAPYLLKVFFLGPWHRVSLFRGKVFPFAYIYIWFYVSPQLMLSRSLSRVS